MHVRTPVTAPPPVANVGVAIRGQNGAYRRMLELASGEGEQVPEILGEMSSCRCCSAASWYYGTRTLPTTPADRTRRLAIRRRRTITAMMTPAMRQ